MIHDWPVLHLYWNWDKRKWFYLPDSPIIPISIVFPGFYKRNGEGFVAIGKNDYRVVTNPSVMIVNTDELTELKHC